MAYRDSPTALPPMVNLGVSLTADGFAVEVICLAPPSAPAGPETLVPGAALTEPTVNGACANASEPPVPCAEPRGKSPRMQSVKPKRVFMPGF